MPQLVCMQQKSKNISLETILEKKLTNLSNISIDNEKMTQKAKDIFAHIELNPASQKQIALFTSILKHKECLLDQELQTLIKSTSIFSILCVPLDALTCGTLKHCLSDNTRRYITTFGYATDIAALRTLIESKQKKLKME
jgi:hypothetical protein